MKSRAVTSIAERIGILARTKNLTWLCDVRRHALSVRTDNLTWRHHYEVASLKLIVEDKDKLKLGNDTDYVRLPGNPYKTRIRCHFRTLTRFYAHVCNCIE